MYTFAFRHKIGIVNRKTMKAACVSVTAQNRNFFCSKFCCKKVLWFVMFHFLYIKWDMKQWLWIEVVSSTMIRVS